MTIGLRSSNTSPLPFPSCRYLTLSNATLSLSPRTTNTSPTPPSSPPPLTNSTLITPPSSSPLPPSTAVDALIGVAPPPFFRLPSAL